MHRNTTPTPSKPDARPPDGWKRAELDLSALREQLRSAHDDLGAALDTASAGGGAPRVGGLALARALCAKMDALVLALVTAPTKGTVTGVVPNLTYTPTEDANGPDSFVYQVTDGELFSERVTVTVTITAANSAPFRSPAVVWIPEKSSPDTSTICCWIGTSHPSSMAFRIS